MISELSLENPVNGHGRHGIVRSVDNPKAAVTIIHGFGEHAGRYEPMMEFLATHNIASLAIDLEGHGRSGPKQGVCKNYDIMQADVALAMAESAKRFPGVPQFLYGHSMGGGLALNYGLKQSPDIAGYLVSAPLIHPADPVPKPLQTIVKVLRKLMPNLTLGNAIDGAKVSSIPEQQDLYESDPLNHGKLGVGLAVDMIEGGEWVAENAENWNAPLLLLHARKDQLTRFDSSQEFSDKAQNCKFIPMEDCEHEMHNDVTQDAVFAAMKDFIEAQI